MIRELRTLVAVAQEGTFAAAGDKVGLTQAAVSTQMQRLEAQLGFPLFDRTARSAKLNTRGLEVLEQSRELLRLYGSLGSPAAGPSTRPLVTIGAIASAQRAPLPAALARFHRRHPDARTRVVPGVSSALVDRVDARELEIAIVIRPPFALPRELEWVPLAQEPYRLLLPKGTRGSDWRELVASHSFIRYDRTSYGGRQVDRFLRSHHVETHDACEIDELDALVGLVQQGLGVALVPQAPGYGRWPAGVRQLDLGDDAFHREVGLVHLAERTLSAPARELVTDIRATYARRR